MQITSNIYLVGGSSLSDPSDAAIYLIKGAEKAALVDSGTGKGSEQVIKNVKETRTELNDIKCTGQQKNVIKWHSQNAVFCHCN